VESVGACVLAVGTTVDSLGSLVESVGASVLDVGTFVDLVGT